MMKIIWPILFVLVLGCDKNNDPSPSIKNVYPVQGVFEVININGDAPENTQLWIFENRKVYWDEYLENDGILRVEYDVENWQVDKLEIDGHDKPDWLLLFPEVGADSVIMMHENGEIVFELIKSKSASQFCLNNPGNGEPYVSGTYQVYKVNGDPFNEEEYWTFKSGSYSVDMWIEEFEFDPYRQQLYGSHGIIRRNTTITQWIGNKLQTESYSLEIYEIEGSDILIKSGATTRELKKAASYPVCLN